ncbi:YybH family protein [Nocardia niigatensis]|uniref:YybH family protein n=1 Tax=Nocardia niigatensis TaxID=209249 RepID=UPI000314F751|nr:SgcJ/EcaC family oxidoreductase [Nocardia niigatensis]
MTARITDPAQLPRVFEARLNAGDVEGVLSLFTPGATMRTTTGAVISGREALHQEISGTVAAHGRLTNNSKHLLTAGDAALLVTNWTLEIDGPDGTRVTPAGTTANIARRIANGEWRFAVLNPLRTA